MLILIKFFRNEKIIFLFFFQSFSSKVPSLAPHTSTSSTLLPPPPPSSGTTASPLKVKKPSRPSPGVKREAAADITVKREDGMKRDVVDMTVKREVVDVAVKREAVDVTTRPPPPVVMGGAVGGGGRGAAEDEYRLKHSKLFSPPSPEKKVGSFTVRYLPTFPFYVFF